MSQFIEPSFFETLFDIILFAVGILVCCCSFYFMGRIEENKKLLAERRRAERIKSLNSLLDRMRIEDVEREQCQI
jgi:hypothetical protein